MPLRVDAAGGWSVETPPPGVPQLAGWGRRFAAYCIDNLLLLLPFPVAIAVLIAGDEAGNDAVKIAGGVLFVLAFLAQPVYFTVLHGRTAGQTLGKRWLGLRVVDARVGGPIGYGRAFGRWMITFVFGFFCAILTILDGLWPLWDEQRQCWHDKVASSVVVKLPA
jgi:uncharacterized RDD family membrane protein YckC